MEMDRNFAPNRVLLDSEGTAVPSRIAWEKYGIIPDIIFMRDDGWSLAAPKHLANVAYELWKDHWKYFIIRPSTTWQNIEEYNPSEF